MVTAESGWKPWPYLLISHDAVNTGATLAGLKSPIRDRRMNGAASNCGRIGGKATTKRRVGSSPVHARTRL